MTLKFTLISSNDKTIHALKYIVLPSICLSVIALISTNPFLWISSSIHHFYIELFGAILAGVLAFYYISRAHTLTDKFSLFIGIGFLVNALIDLLHVIVSFLNMDDILFLKFFIPQTWFAGRLFLSAMLAIAIVKYTTFSSNNSNINKEQQQQQQQKQEILYTQNDKNKLSRSILLYLIAVTLFSLVIAISSFFVIFPFSVVDSVPLHRPYELFPLGLFLFSLYYFYKNKIYVNKDIFYTSLVISIVFDIFGQIIIAYSAYNFDTAHNIAHVIKDTGYFINVIGLALSSIQYNIRFRQSNELLNKQNILLHQQYEKVKESEKIKEEFINIAAHELRTPIQPILGLTDIMYSKFKGEEQRELLEIIMRNATRLKKLTDNVLDVTKIESHSLILNKETLNLNTLISEILKEYSKKVIKQPMAKIVYDFKHTEDIIVEADRDRLVQVLHNLLDNALKFTDSSQMISVIIDKKREEGKEREEFAIIRVKDKGEGIPDKILSHLFKKLVPTDSSTGTGLGLYICKNIIEAHGGKIWAENNPDSNGATIGFTLPIKVQQ